MASLFKRGSIFWIKYRGNDGKIHRESLNLPTNTVEGRREAKRIKDEASLKERLVSRAHVGSRFSDWVVAYLQQRYNHKPTTLHRYKSCWERVENFLAQQGIFHPSAVKYQHGVDYAAWRTSDGTNHNTMVMDMITFRLVMGEAVRRSFCTGCPIQSIARRKPEPKPAFTDEDIAKCREELKKYPQWMQDAFEISMYTGCRLSETSIPMKLIDLKLNTITFPTPKGGSARAYSVPIHPDLIPLLRRMKSENRTVTLTLPQKNHRSYWKDINTNWFSRFFARLHKRSVLSDSKLTFHGLRVTFVTRHLKAGTSQHDVMKLVNHSSVLVNEIYNRVVATDISVEKLKAVRLPPPPTVASGQQEKSTSAKPRRRQV